MTLIDMTVDVDAQVCRDLTTLRLLVDAICDEQRAQLGYWWAEPTRDAQLVQLRLALVRPRVDATAYERTATHPARRARW